jgi:sarcosine oxidase delta subunit
MKFMKWLTLKKCPFCGSRFGHKFYSGARCDILRKVLINTANTIVQEWPKWTLRK